jgi:hypothetical protein
MRLLACSILALVVLVCSSTRAYADGPSATWDGNPPQAAPPVAPIGGYPYGAAPYGAAPYGAAPYGAAYGNSYGVSPQAMMFYDNEKKNAGIAVLLEFLVPGVGSVYADHGMGALITWGLMIGGFVVIVWDLESQFTTNPDGTTTTNGSFDATPVLLGIGLILAGRIYGFVDSYSSCTNYNRALAQRLGLPLGVALNLAPIRMDQNVAWGPALSLRF